MKKCLLLFAALAAFTLMTGSLSAQSTIVMNEIYSRGTSSAPDWIELYNPTASAVDISAYKIYDNGGQGGTKPKKSFPAGTSIPSKGFYVIVTDDGAADAFGLSSSGEKVWLEDATGTIIDTVTFAAYEATQSYARIPDGSGNWKIVNTITRGTSNGGGTGVGDEAAVIGGFSLFQNYPNPFNPSTSISYQLPKQELVSVKIYDISGRLVTELVNEVQTAGLHAVNFNAANLSSGSYFYTVKTGTFSDTKKLMLIK